MELEELKATLAALDRHLERLAASDARETERRTRRAVRSSLRPLAIGNVVQVAFGLLAILLGVATWRSDLVRFGDVFISGVVVHAYGAATIGLAVATLVMIGRIDQAGPVLAVQKRLAELRRLLITAAYALGMTWWVLWVPFGIAIFRVAFGVDLFAHAPDVALVLVASGVVGKVGLEPT